MYVEVFPHASTTLFKHTVCNKKIRLYKNFKSLLTLDQFFSEKKLEQKVNHVRGILDWWFWFVIGALFEKRCYIFFKKMDALCLLPPPPQKKHNSRPLELFLSSINQMPFAATNIHVLQFDWLLQWAFIFDYSSIALNFCEIFSFVRGLGFWIC